MQHGFTSSRRRADHTNWSIWSSFCADLSIPTYLSFINDPIPILQIFAHRVRAGVLAAKGRRVKKRSVEQYLCSIWTGWAKSTFAYNANSPPTKKKTLRPPASNQSHCISSLTSTAGHAPSPNNTSTSLNLPWSSSSSFSAQANTAMAAATHNNPHFASATSTSLPARENSEQQLPPSLTSPAPHPCPSLLPPKKTVSKAKPLATAWRTTHLPTLYASSHPLCAANVHLTQPLASVYVNGQWTTIKSTAITTALCTSAAAIGDSLGFALRDISTRLMRAGGAMALLLSNVDTDRIKLLGRWRSDAMMRYLHTTACPLIQDFARSMVANGEYAQIPNPDDA
mmetsp:Transcript_31242/g.57939  ORF Transcript_31242/g.57939 Transcript_31242/m.57939 type:complete len:340 (-) Transcript_31242:306-1325(-)